MKGCYNDPRTNLTDEDKKQVAVFMDWVASRHNRKAMHGPMIKCNACETPYFSSLSIERRWNFADGWHWLCLPCCELQGK